jgi:hypothetical protein
MALPELVRRRAEQQLQAYCEKRVPPHARSQVQLLVTLRGNTATIHEQRPAWRPELRGKFSRMAIAQFRYEGSPHETEIIVR